MIGLSNPPADPGGGVISVKTRSDRPLKPSHSSTPRIITSQPSPNSVAASESAIVMKFLDGGERRKACISGPRYPIRFSIRISI